MSTLWVETYRPNNFKDYIGNADVVKTFQSYIDNQDMPHLLLHGEPGTGKTTAAKILGNRLEADVKIINASDENGVEAIREKVKRFAGNRGFSKWKILVLDESDYLSSNAQAILRNLMEEYSQYTRFILTCNYPNRIIPAIHSRCQTFRIEPPDAPYVAQLVKSILDREQIEYNKATVIKDIVAIVNAHYPDIRKVIQYAEQCCYSGELRISSEFLLKSEYIDSVISELKSNNKTLDKFQNIRKLIQDARVKDFAQLYTELYKQAENYAAGNVAMTIIEIAEAQKYDMQVPDKEINVMAMILKILDLIQ